MDEHRTHESTFPTAEPPDPAFEVGAARYLLRRGLSRDETVEALIEEAGAPPDEAAAAVLLASLDLVMAT